MNAVPIRLAIAIVLCATPVAAQSDALTRDSLAAARAEVDSHPDDRARRLTYARMLRTVFLFADARAQLQAVVERDGSDADAWLELARVEARAGNRGVAGSHAQRARDLGASGAVELFEELAAAVRMQTGKRHLPQPKSDAATVADLLSALKKDDTAKAAELMQVPAADVGALVAAYGAYLHRVTGVEWLDFEVAPAETPSQVRVRLFWSVEPAKLEPAAMSSLPPAYVALLPLGWMTGLDGVGDPELREEALARARAARWTEVTLATATVEGGKVTALTTAGGNVLAESLPVVHAAAGEPTTAPADGDKGPVDEKALRHEMFKNRYGKREAPVTGDAYMYRQIIFGLFIVALCALGLVWLVRRELRKDRESGE